jgi:hypothetical protein
MIAFMRELQQQKAGLGLSENSRFSGASAKRSFAAVRSQAELGNEVKI